MHLHLASWRCGSINYLGLPLRNESVHFIDVSLIAPERHSEGGTLTSVVVHVSGATRVQRSVEAARLRY